MRIQPTLASPGVSIQMSKFDKVWLYQVIIKRSYKMMCTHVAPQRTSATSAVFAPVEPSDFEVGFRGNDLRPKTCVTATLLFPAPVVLTLSDLARSSSDWAESSAAASSLGCRDGRRGWWYGG